MKLFLVLLIPMLSTESKQEFCGQYDNAQKCMRGGCVVQWITSEQFICVPNNFIEEYAIDPSNPPPSNVTNITTTTSTIITSTTTTDGDLITDSPEVSSASVVGGAVGGLIGLILLLILVYYFYIRSKKKKKNIETTIKMKDITERYRIAGEQILQAVNISKRHTTSPIKRLPIGGKMIEKGDIHMV